MQFLYHHHEPNQMTSAGQSWLSNVVRLAAEEVERGGARSESLLAKVAELMFVEALQRARTAAFSLDWECSAM